MQISKANKPVVKPDAVNIKQIQVTPVPTPMGTLNISLWGLGDDNKVYTWESKDHQWVLS